MTFLTETSSRGKFDEALKYNATLMIGDLTADERSPLLWGAGLQGSYQLREESSPKLDYLKVAAMVGLQRHAEGLATASPSPIMTN